MWKVFLCVQFLWPLIYDFWIGSGMGKSCKIWELKNPSKKFLRTSPKNFLIRSTWRIIFNSPLNHFCCTLRNCSSCTTWVPTRRGNKLEFPIKIVYIGSNMRVSVDIQLRKEESWWEITWRGNKKKEDSDQGKVWDMGHNYFS